ncbi:hypothetical protein [Flavobacterium sp.]|uniref:hypothetical protein n=1 Tax=Flavobacterium sp. TaxID=239 RepID=UPI002621387B|nr:hypothetical protein [Flavobacterium sp.]
MKLTYLMVFASCFTMSVFAQDNTTIPSTSIPRGEINTPNNSNATPQYSISKPFEITRFKVPQKFEPISMEKGMQVQLPKSDLKPGLDYEKKLNKKPSEGTSDSKIFRRDENFGQFETESATLVINYRDFGMVDGDLVRVWVDGKLMIDMLPLDGNTNKVSVGLMMGINFIQIEAVNEGMLSPNTGEFALIEDDGNTMTSSQWNLASGFKATFNVLRVAKGTLNKTKKPSK